MRSVLTIALLATLLSFKSYAADTDAVALPPGTVLFEGVQAHCVQVGDIKFGPGTPWNNCHITRARWISTIGLIDMYQAQYCLGKDEAACEQRAWVVFANRAYTADAKALVVRTDAAETVYEDPLVIVMDDNRLMSMPSRSKDGTRTVNYFMWDADHWMPVDLQHLQHDVSAKLPKGVSLRTPVWPNLESMTVEADLFKAGDLDAMPTGGQLSLDLGFENSQFVVKNTHINPPIK